MPVVGISTSGLRERLGAGLTGSQIAAAVDALGCDLEELAVVHLFTCPACGITQDRLPREDPPSQCDVCGHTAAVPFEKTGEDERIRLDLLPARPDLFNAPGLSRALRGYLGVETGLPEYAIGEPEITVEIDASVGGVRPFIACAQVDVPPLDQEKLVVLFRLQEDLHWGVGRGRRKASIGVYDRDKIGDRVSYTTWDPAKTFVPLGMPGREMSLAAILAEHPKGTGYRHLLEGFDRYPVLVDERGQVLSMPPIINSEETKLTVGSTRLFIDVTGTDLRAVEDSLALLVSDACELGGRVRAVTMVRGGETSLAPDLAPARWAFSPARAARLIGVPMDADRARGLLLKMRLGVEDGPGDGNLTVVVPRYRVDVRHEVDLIEDVAIAHGYDNLPATLVPTMTVGRPHPAMELARCVREILTGLGFVEQMNLNLTNRDDHVTKMRLEGDLGEVRLMNPISVHQEIVRVHLLSDLMSNFALNKTREMPQLVFQVGEVVRATENSSIEGRHLAIGIMGPRADYAAVRSVVDALLKDLSVVAEIGPGGDHELAPAFIDGRVAAVRIGAERAVAGVMGEVHPEVIVNFGLDHPIALAEIDLAPLLRGEG